MNLYGMVGNDPINRWDRFGLIGLDTGGTGLGINPPQIKTKKEIRAQLIKNITSGGFKADTGGDSCCVVITVIIKLPNPEAKGWDGKGMGGHTGIGVFGEFYDYGPVIIPGVTTNKDINIMGTDGRPWWDGNQKVFPGKKPEDIDLGDIIRKIDRLAHGLDVFSIEIAVPKKDAKKVENWWKNKYKNLGTYAAIADQCTTTVMTSLDTAGVFSEPWFTWSPVGYLKSLKDAKHKCGLNKDKKAKIKKIH